jgi:hypothetical protein
MLVNRNTAHVNFFIHKISKFQLLQCHHEYVQVVIYLLQVSVRLLCFVQTPVVTSRLAQARMGVFLGHMLQLNCLSNLSFQDNVLGRLSCVPLQGYASSPEL